MTFISTTGTLTMDDDYIGQQLGPYQLLRQLGAGSFGSVYLAEHRYLETLVAIKMLKVSMEREQHGKFLQEARLNARLQHAHIIRIITFDFQDQIPYLVMEYVPNGTLRTLHPKGTRVPLAQITNYVKQIACALDYAHRQQVVHRDIKPENLLLGTEHEVILSDFGLAIVQQTLDSLSSQGPAGTPFYMAPEQLQHRPCPASDQYALGVMVYEWLCGQPPFVGSLYRVLSQHLYEPPPSLCARLPELSPVVEETVFRALTKEPAQRFACVEDFACALEDAACATELRVALKVRTAEQGLRQTPAPPPTLSASSDPLTSIAPIPVNQEQSPTVPTPTAVVTEIQALTTQPTQLPLPVRAMSHQTTQGNSPRTNRQILLHRVRSFWINGVLQHSLHGAALMVLGLQEQTDAVAQPWCLALQTPNLTAQTIPAGTSISKVYDDADGNLLILGAPGAGKTTLLLTLAQDLLTRAEHNASHPVPVVLTLASWSSKQSLTEWLVAELNSKYQVPRKLGKRLVEADQILPLLDGLDEIAPKERTACIEAINTYKQERGFLPLVVCSRSADYLTLSTRVHLRSAVTIQPLNTQQVNAYLTRAGEGLRGLQIALQRDQALREFTHSPLLLSLLSLTYAHRSAQEIFRLHSPTIHVHQVIERYVEQMLTHGNTSTRYTMQETKHWLAWLARQLQQHNQSVFAIESMQPDWTEEPSTRKSYPRIVSGLLFALLGVAISGPIWGVTWLQSSPVSPFQHIQAPFLRIGLAFLSTLINSACFGLVNALLYKGPSRKASATPAQLRWRQIRGSISRSVANGLLCGLFLGSLTSLVTSADTDLIGMLGTGLIIGAVGIFIFGVVEGLLQLQPLRIQPTEAITWSWGQMGRNLIKFALVGLLCALLLGVFMAIITIAADAFAPDKIIGDLQLGLEDAVTPGLSFGFIGAILGGLIGGLSHKVLARRNTEIPNEGIRRSALLGLRVGLIGIIGTALFLGLLVLIAIHKHTGLSPLVWGIILSPLITLVIALRVGGIAVIQHGVLRWQLWRARAMPWNYARFLDHAAGRILLQKVGGGYMFVHRFVLEYFADLERQ